MQKKCVVSPFLHQHPSCVWPQVECGSDPITTPGHVTPSPTSTAMQVYWWPLPSSRGKLTISYSSSLDVRSL